MKKRFLTGLLAMTLVISLAMPTAAAGFVGSNENGGGGNGGVEIPQEPEKPQEPQEPTTPPPDNAGQTPVTPPPAEKPDTKPPTETPTTPPDGGEGTNKKPEAPTIVTLGGSKPLTIVTSKSKGDGSLLIGGANAGGNSLEVTGGQDNGDGTLTLGDGNRITTQEERESIVAGAQTTVMITNSQQNKEHLKNFDEKETTEQTKWNESSNKRVENGVSLEDSVQTDAMAETAKSSEKTTEVLEKLSPELTAKVQDAVGQAVPKLLGKIDVVKNVLNNVIETLTQQTDNTTEVVDLNELKENLVSDDPQQAAELERIINKLEKKNVPITQEVLKEEFQKYEERQQVLQNIQNGNLDEMSVHSVFDITVSDDIKEMVKQEGSYVDIPVDMPGIDEDTLVVAIKPVQKKNVTIEEEETFKQLLASAAGGNTQELFEKLGKEFIIVECTPYDGGVTLRMYNFSPVMILTYSGETEDAEPVEEPVEESAETVVVEPEEKEADSNMALILVLILVAVLILVVVAVYRKKKSGGKTEE